MKLPPLVRLIGSSVVLCMAILRSAFADIQIPSDGSDGDLVVPANTNLLVINLADAVTGPWNANNAEHAGRGIYDPEKWAVVFKYRSVNVRANTRVSFLNHESRAPVVWLVSGSAEILGTVSLDATAEQSRTSEPGPGGFRGSLFDAGGSGQAGFGPAGGAYRAGGYYFGRYGNSRVLPLIGGSGGGQGKYQPYQSADFPGLPGGAGGGAMLLAVAQDLTLDGLITANGSSGASYNGADSYHSHGTGSGGAIRIIADRIFGRGQLTARANPPLHRATVGGVGRIRVEANVVSGLITASPEVSNVAPGSPPKIWDESAPAVRISSIGGVAIDDEPTASLEISGADASIQSAARIPIIIETTNLDPATTSVRVRIVQKYGAVRELSAVVQPNSTRSAATWLLEETFPSGFATLQVHAVGQ